MMGGQAGRDSAFELGTDGPRSILVGVDGSESSMRAGAYAAGLARRQHCPLTVLFVRTVPVTPAAAFDGSGAVVAARLAELDEVEAELRATLDHYVGSLEVQFLVRRGNPAQTIREVAEEVRAEAIVVGASRAGSFFRSGAPVSHALVKERSWPVVVVP